MEASRIAEDEFRQGFWREPFLCHQLSFLYSDILYISGGECCPVFPFKSEVGMTNEPFSFTFVVRQKGKVLPDGHLSKSGKRKAESGNLRPET